ncbi:MAG: hypothetical protein J6I73_01175 [Treponema sp.]|nr:hypothetical protein [Treponema sp.]
MVVVIPHQSEQLILVRAQKYMITVLNEQQKNKTQDSIWHPVFPLWITFDDNMPLADFDTAKSTFAHMLSDKAHADNALCSLTICAPHIAAAALIFPATMQLKKGSIIGGKITAGIQRQYSYNAPTCTLHTASAAAACNEITRNENTYTPASDATHITATAELPISCTVFRIACAEIVEDAQHVRTWRVQKSHWVKIV